MDLVEGIIETSKSRGCTTILFEQVHHPMLLELQGPIEDTYRRRLTRVLEQRKVTYLSYREHIDFDARDFADHLHLGAFGKKRFEAWFVAELVNSNFIREI